MSQANLVFRFRSQIMLGLECADCPSPSCVMPDILLQLAYFIGTLCCVLWDASLEINNVNIINKESYEMYCFCLHLPAREKQALSSLQILSTVMANCLPGMASVLYSPRQSLPSCLPNNLSFFKKKNSSPSQVMR